MFVISEFHTLNTEHGEFEVCVAVSGAYSEKVIIVKKEGSKSIPMYLRIQFGCAYGHILDSIDCDCKFQTAAALQKIHKYGGYFIYFPEAEAYGLGLFEKANLMRLEKMDKDQHRASFEKMQSSGKSDEKIVLAAKILSELKNLGDFIMISNNEKKRKILEKSGIKIKNSITIEVDKSKLSKFAVDEIVFKESYG